MMKIGPFVFLAMLPVTPAWAVDLSTLPQSCQASIASMKADKPHFAQLNKVMSASKKASNTTAFCGAARDALSLVIDQNKRLDNCLGDAVNDRNASKDAIDELTNVKSYYRKMLEAAKQPDNDKFHCGLADL